MNKGIADQFLRELTDSPRSSEEDPRVILIRSNRGIKRFITDALNEVEHLVTLVQEPILPCARVSEHLACLADLAQRHEQRSIHACAHAIGELARAMSREQVTKESKLGKAFTEFVTYLSTMLLRVYIEGSDEKCTWEHAGVDRLLEECRSTRRVVETSDRRWVN